LWFFHGPEVFCLDILKQIIEALKKVFEEKHPGAQASEGLMPQRWLVLRRMCKMAYARRAD
jgi:hypothetical protein